jgi:hypothetical protein
MPFRLKDHPNLAAMRIENQFYLQIFFELINNAIIHGLEIEKRVRIRWRVAEESFNGIAKPALVLTNEWLVEPFRHLPPLDQNVSWRPVESLSPSGLQFVSNTLTATASGSIATMVDINTKEFSVALFLSGLTV